jgi:hypothetical protein
LSRHSQGRAHSSPISAGGHERSAPLAGSHGRFPPENRRLARGAMIIMAVQRTGRTVSETYRSRYRLPANVALVRFSAVPGGPSAISWSIPFFANQCSSPSLSLRSTEYPSSISVRCARTAFLLPPIPHASQVGDWPSPRGSYRSCPRSPTTAAGHKRRFRGTGDKSARPPIPERLRHCSEPTLRAKRRSRACPRICEMAFQNVPKSLSFAACGEWLY